MKYINLLIEKAQTECSNILIKISQDEDYTLDNYSEYIKEIMGTINTLSDEEKDMYKNDFNNLYKNLDLIVDAIEKRQLVLKEEMLLLKKRKLANNAYNIYS